ncbi:MAG: GIY-YIG nuclease family protein, partial [Paludibacteraceae bacterium]|nr:GIY-YIG nuclease family protein [Paludibacteraceae bacterium]
MVSKNPHIQDILQRLPDEPGVYQYLNEIGEVIYVGKAKSLKKRVSSYFHKEQDRYKTKLLVKSIADIKYVVVQSEQDAF